MEVNFRYTLEQLKKRNVLNNLAKELNISSSDLYNFLDKKIYSFLEDIDIFLIRLFSKCFDKNENYFRDLPLEVMLYLLYVKQDDIKKCFPYLREYNTLFRLKKLPTQEEFNEIINILAIIGKYIGKTTKVRQNYKQEFETLQIKRRGMKIEHTNKSTIRLRKIPASLAVGLIASILLAGIYIYQNDKIERLKTKLVEYQIKLDQYEKTLEQLNKENQNLKEENKKLKTEIENLKNELSKCKKAIKK